MPHIDADPLRLPFSGSEPLSRHCSHQGALAAKEHAGRLCLKLLATYRQHGPQTDAEMAALLGVQRTSINSTRGELVRLGLVGAVGTKKNAASGIRNVTWGLR